MLSKPGADASDPQAIEGAEIARFDTEWSVAESSHANRSKLSAVELLTGLGQSCRLANALRDYLVERGTIMLDRRQGPAIVIINVLVTAKLPSRLPARNKMLSPTCLDPQTRCLSWKRIGAARGTYSSTKR